MTLAPALKEYIHDNQDRFLRDIARLAAQPSVSATKDGVEECALLVKKMIEEIGGKAQLLRLDGAAPLVYGEVMRSGALEVSPVQAGDPRREDVWQGGL